MVSSVTVTAVLSDIKSGRGWKKGNRVDKASDALLLGGIQETER